MTQGTVWKVSAYPIRMRTWDLETAAYHTGSGDTLLLSPLATEILHRLQKGQAAESELVDAVSEAFAEEAAPHLQAAVTACLQYLEKARMVEPTS